MVCSASKNVWAQRVSTKCWMIIIIARPLAISHVFTCSNVQYLISSPSAHIVLMSLEEYKLQTSLASQLVILLLVPQKIHNCQSCQQRYIFIHIKLQLTTYKADRLN